MKKLQKLSAEFYLDEGQMQRLEKITREVNREAASHGLDGTATPRRYF